MELKNIVKGSAKLLFVKSGGIAVYELNSIDGKKYHIEIDLSDKNDVGETAIFKTEYVKSLMLMRWIRRSIENGTLVEI